MYICAIFVYMKANKTHKRIAKLMVEKRGAKTRNQISKATGLHARLIKNIEEAEGYNIQTLCVLLSFYEVELGEIQKCYK